MKTARRKFAQLLGASLFAPVVAVRGASLWERAELEVEQTGEVSPDVTLALLDAQGTRGIFEDRQAFEELRAALARKIEVHKFIRSYEVPPDIEPLLSFRR
jgi:hypothetical protein